MIWATGPPSSTLTLYAIWQGLAAGVPVLASGPWRGVTGSLAEQARRASIVHAVPTVAESILAALADDAGRAGRRSLPGRAGPAGPGRPWRLRTAVVAGAAPGPGLRDLAGRVGVRLVEYYGAAELSFVAVDADGRGLRPFPGVEVEIRDGVLWARSAYLADEVDGVGVRERDGWATVGDRARWDADGALRVLGREGSANVAGHVVRLADVEALLAGVGGVAEAVCLAAPDQRVGQRVVAVVRPLPGADPLPDLRRAVSGLPAAARPARYRLLDALPHTPSGKVDRAVLEDWWTAAPR